MIERGRRGRARGSAHAAEVALSVASGKVDELRQSGLEPVDVLVAPRVRVLLRTLPPPSR